eukprot:6458104-Amphidinium_carterae.2
MKENYSCQLLAIEDPQCLLQGLNLLLHAAAQLAANAALKLTHMKMSYLLVWTNFASLNKLVEQHLSWNHSIFALHDSTMLQNGQVRALSLRRATRSS